MLVGEAVLPWCQSPTDKVAWLPPNVIGNWHFMLVDIRHMFPCVTIVIPRYYCCLLLISPSLLFCLRDHLPRSPTAWAHVGPCLLVLNFGIWGNFRTNEVMQWSAQVGYRQLTLAGCCKPHHWEVPCSRCNQVPVGDTTDTDTEVLGENPSSSPLCTNQQSAGLQRCIYT